MIEALLTRAALKPAMRSMIPGGPHLTLYFDHILEA
jgi:hypothetical protein